MSLVKKSACAVLLLGCVGCAHMPDVTVGYYLARTKATFKVIRTVACDANNNIIVANAVTPAVTHFADRDQRHQVSLAPLKGFLSNSDVKFEFYDDGRLKGVNATTTGQGEAILKTALTIASTLGAFSGSRAASTSTECALINKVSPGKPLSLTYEGDVEMDRQGLSQAIPPDTASAVYASQLRSAISGVCAKVMGIEQATAPVGYEGKRNEVLLTVRQPGLVRIRVAATDDKECMKDTIWDGKVLAGQSGTAYSMPIPAAAVFGKQTFAVTVHESGALTMMQYASDTGTGQVLNVIGSALTEIQGEAGRKAAALRAEADLIAAQQRLVKCRADPTTCS